VVEVEADERAEGGREESVHHGCEGVRGEAADGGGGGLEVDGVVGGGGGGEDAEDGFRVEDVEGWCGGGGREHEWVLRAE
jgi:hypothetical protein